MRRLRYKILSIKKEHINREIFDFYNRERALWDRDQIYHRVNRNAATKRII